MKNVNIAVWVKFSELKKFKKEWKYLFDAKTYYSQNKFQYNGVPLYTQKMMGEFVQLQLRLDDYLFWSEKTKE